MPLTFNHDTTIRISPARDDFDITFEEYTSSAAPSSHARAPGGNDTYPVPAIIHNVFLGSSDLLRSSWALAAHACRVVHPDYNFEFWDNARAERFVRREYPELWPTWKNYRYDSQRADSLRYMVLHHYGGIFLDLDLLCLRPLTPLRAFDFVAPAAYPSGISNGFLLSRPKGPFLAEVISNLPRYDVSWFGLPHATISFSTGCHFLSTMHLFTKTDRSILRILWGPRRLHHLSGNATTPLFHHFGSSSRHSYNADFFEALKPPPQSLFRIGATRSERDWAAIILFTAIAISTFVATVLFVVYRLKTRSNRQRLVQ
ncbi:hypothetical protein PV08_04320 [Exophiala spinifera]|uniref:Alpha 1,4-glycosyltransferase domain-containing protein n=1 Tax=Exophiala spinifera TaxID=91928 RepID=A0A0D2C0H2_9EURO|nr:uncharacterized protein PV08_04320 [Exophiala spinifera]KIW17129.1 hypothetical protein PV08_04320 [Exophiala spinifera]